MANASRFVALAVIIVFVCAHSICTCMLYTFIHECGIHLIGLWCTVQSTTQSESFALHDFVEKIVVFVLVFGDQKRKRAKESATDAIIIFAMFLFRMPASFWTAALTLKWFVVDHDDDRRLLQLTIGQAQPGLELNWFSICQAHSIYEQRNEVFFGHEIICLQLLEKYIYESDSSVQHIAPRHYFINKYYNCRGGNSCASSTRINIRVDF